MVLGFLQLLFYVWIPSGLVYKIVRHGQQNPAELNTYRYYFLVARYGIENMHWSCLTLFRNITLAMIPVLTGPDAGWQLLLFSMYASFWSILIAYKRPWILLQITLLDSFILMSVALIAAWGYAHIDCEDIEAARDVAVGGSCLVLFLVFSLITVLFVKFSIFNYKDFHSSTTRTAQLAANINDEAVPEHMKETPVAPTEKSAASGLADAMKKAEEQSRDQVVPMAAGEAGPSKSDNKRNKNDRHSADFATKFTEKLPKNTSTHAA